MGTPPISEAEIQETIRVYLACGRNATEAARLRNIPRTRINHHLHKARERNLIPPIEPEPIVEVEVPAPKPVVRVRAVAPSLDLPSRRVICIGDTHWRPGMDFQHMRWIGRYVTENRPDNVVHIGDALDFESCEFHSAPGSASHARRPSFAEDIEAGEDALAAYHAEIPTGEIPHDIVFGNHEDRVWRYEEAAPNLAGTLVLQLEQLFARYRWRTHPYRRKFFLDEVCFIHAPQTTLRQPISGKYPENTIGRDWVSSVVSGHTHRWKHIIVPKDGRLDKITVTNVGSAMPHGYIPRYVEDAQTGYSWGIVDMRLRGGCVESPHFISMLDLRDRYA